MRSVKDSICKPVTVPNVYTQLLGAVRALLAIPPLLTLIFTDPQFLLRPAAGATVESICTDINSYGLFCLLNSYPSWIPRIVGILVCVWVIVGVFPKVSAVLFLWIAFTLQNNNVVADGGDQILLNLSVFFTVLTLLDNRPTSWSRPSHISQFRASAGVVMVAVIKMQFVVLYLQSGIAKVGVETWADGTEVYYDVNAPMLGAVGPVKEFMNWIFESPALLQATTWGTMACEVFIAYSIVGALWAKKVSFFMVIVLHLSIAITLGIVTFSLTMIIGASFALVPLGKYSKVSGMLQTRLSHADSRIRARTTRRRSIQLYSREG